MAKPSLLEIEWALKGAWMLAKGDKEGLHCFDHSPAAFWRSFWVAALLVPFVLVSVATDRMITLQELPVGKPEEVVGFSLQPHILKAMLSLGVEMVTFPLLVAVLAETLSMRTRYASYIAINNWATLLVVFPFTFLHVLYLVGFLGLGPLVMLSLLATGWMGYYRYALARVVAEVNIASAIGLALLGFLLSLVIDLGLTHLIL
ncbi:hypothetical protein [Polycladidibacter hongkongensis]|uniref:hypothetical protein n=1 Tax=Polycladidibacter hongkongensis TaxID=1647556 RepID=UPI00082CB18C|nr:hypothetical protein [Pseudovibrio hongkongensis]